MNTLPPDYEERVYAGVLGKIIGVYLGRPFEGWTNKRIEDELGEVHYYVHEKLKQPLIVADDDISGTFTFLRALEDYDGTGHDLTAEQIGQTWLNYLIENKTVLWWGGMGHSTEHTAYMRLKNGVPAPRSGSAQTNGKVVSEQIGAQIFIDGWAMACPGDPEKAVALARKAASVSHDGEAIYGAEVIAAIEALAFTETDRNVLLHTASTFIPRESVIYHLIQDLWKWKDENPHDWRAAFRKIEDVYGYDKYGGNCHMVPNHAIILLALLYGDDDFGKSLMIANTAGWDTDCNSANVGCIMGIKNGLAGLDAGADFRGPVADRLYLPTADGGRCISDAVQEAYRIVNMGRRLQNLRPVRPNGGMRFHFNLPGSVQGFQSEDSAETRGTVALANIPAPVAAEGEADDERCLAIRYNGVAPGRAARVATPTFLPPDLLKGGGGYGMTASPTLYAGQTVRARIVADENNEKLAHVRLYVRVYDKNDALALLRSEPRRFGPGESGHFHWEIPATGGRVIAEVGVEVGGASGTGAVYLDWLSWNGAATTTFAKPDGGGAASKRAWVNAADHFEEAGGVNSNLAYRVIQDAGTGLVLQGEACWGDYTLTARASAHMADRIGLVASANGLRRYIALTLSPDERVRLIHRRDEMEETLAEAPVPWKLDHSYSFSLTVRDDGALEAIVSGLPDGAVGDAVLHGAVPPEMSRGAIGLLVTLGHAHFGPVQVTALEKGKTAADALGDHDAPEGNGDDLGVAASKPPLDIDTELQTPSEVGAEPEA